MSEGRRRRATRGAGETPGADPATSGPGGTGTRSGRRAALAEMQKADQERRRRHVLRVGAPVVLALLVVAALVVAVVRPGSGGGAGDDGPTERRQRTVLLQVVAGPGQPAQAGVVLATTPAAMLTLPGGLVTDVAGRGSVALADTTRTDGTGTQAREALEDQLDLVIDGSWVLDTAALAALVDGVGGVTVDVDTEVRATRAGAQVVLVPEGPAQRLDGSQAAAFATYQALGEPQEVQLARFVTVLRETLGALPDGADEVAGVLAGLTSSSTTLPPEQLSGFVAALRDAVRADSVAYPALPVVADDIADVTTYRLDRADLADVLFGPFADSRPATPAGGTVEVLVQNGVGTAGLLDAARTRLRAADLAFENGGNASRFGYARTLVVVPEDSASAVEKGRLAARALGVPESAVVVGEEAAGVADVVVVLGADFVP